MNTSLKAYAQKTGTIASLIGLVVGFSTILFVFQGAKWITEQYILVYGFIGSASMVAMAYYISGLIVKTATIKLLPSIFRGAGSALLSLLVGILAGWISSCLHLLFLNFDQYFTTDLLFTLLGSLIYIGIFGLLPAAIIGGTWGWLVYKRTTRLP